MRATAGDVLRSLIFYPLFYGATVGFVIVSLTVFLFSQDGFRSVVHGWSGFHRWCVRNVLGIRVVCEGQLPRSDAIIALRHESFFEAIDLPTLIDLPGIFAKAELTRLPLWGRSALAYGIVPVEREQGARTLRAMLIAARALMDEGRVLAIFPEGTRVPHGKVAPLQSGFAGLYKMLGVPVIPVAVDSGPLYHRRWKRKGTITYRVGETIEAGLPRADLERRVLQAINALNDQAEVTLTD